VGTLMFMVLCFVNADSLIARYNVDSYLKGQLPHMQIEDLSELSDSAAPYIEQIILGSKDEDVKKEAIWVLYNMKNNTERSNWKSFNFSSQKAEEIYEKYLKEDE